MSTDPSGYRREIDGLRAVAVLPVILFHAGFEVFSGGFVGVDVFFVISGYLITSIILRERGEGRFSILKFYERRARRILPALFVVVLACLPFALAWMLPWQLKDFGQSALAVALFSSNILFWRQSGYFAPAAEQQPLLHTWSLGVEEQYYILFPLMVLVLWRFGIRRMGWVIAAAALASLGLSELGWRMQPTANFYLLPTRAWELLAGSLLAIWLTSRSRPTGLTAEAGGALGLGLIVWSILSLDKGTPFPGLWALLPVGGSVLVILCASPATWTGRLLGWGPMVGIGLISYSAYLWHQPLFAFARIRSIEAPSTGLMVTLAVLALGLAWITWRYVERPFRNPAQVSRPRIFAGALAGSLLMIATGLTFVLANGLPGRIPAAHRDWAAVSPLTFGDYVKSAYIRDAEDRALVPGKPSLVVVGDSFSQDFYNMVRATGAFPGYAISAVYIPTVCQTYRGPDRIDGYRTPGSRAACARSALEGERLQRVQSADVIVFPAMWKDWSAARIGQTLGGLALRPDQKVLVVGGKSFDRTPRRYLGLPAAALPAVRVAPSAVGLKTDATLRAALPPGVAFVDVFGQLCANGGCPVFTPAGKLISYDGNHLTPAGAAYVGQRLFSAGPLSDYRR